ncbi:MAG: IS1182 family transposase [Chthoniobacterales bacterium]
MNYITGSDRGEVLLLPEALEDYLTPENPVRFLDAFVGQLDLVAAGFKHAQLNETGRPPYDPKDLLRVYLYGYLNRVRSSRALEREATRNLEVIWLLRKLRPDFKTIADFRRDNAKGIKAAGREFTLLCRRLQLFGGDLVAIDSTKIKAQNAKGRNYSAARLAALQQELEEKLSRYLAELDEADAGEDRGPAQLTPAELKEKIAHLEKRKEELRAVAPAVAAKGQVSLTDPDSRAMSMGRGSTIGYNVQAAVDAKHSLIVATEVTQTTSDLGALGTMALQAQETLQAERLSVVADKGYYNGKEILLCDAIGVTAYVAKPLTSANTARGLYGKERFRYDPEKNSYTCPAGQELTYRFTTNESGRATLYYQTSACGACALKSQCTRNKENRRITRRAGEEAQDAMAERVKQHPQIMRRRKAIIEHCFGTIKRSFGYDYFLCRGKRQVTTEVNLTVLAYNLKRVCNILGVQNLIAAVS